MKIIKKYLVFTSVLYRIVMFGILPAGLVVLYVIAMLFMGEDMKYTLILMPFPVILAEIVADTWMFGGIQAKDAAKIDFLKTSPRGMGLLRNALAMDLVRRLVFLSAVMAACALGNIALGVELFGGDAVKGLGVILSLILSAYSVSVLCTVFTRFGTMFWQNIVAAYVGMILESFCVGFLVTLDYPFAWALLYAVLAAGASFLSVKIVMAKIRGGYYDQ